MCSGGGGGGGATVRNYNYYGGPSIAPPLIGGYGYGGYGGGMFAPSIGLPVIGFGGFFNFIFFMVRSPAPVLVEGCAVCAGFVRAQMRRVQKLFSREQVLLCGIVCIVGAKLYMCKRMQSRCLCPFWHVSSCASCLVAAYSLQVAACYLPVRKSLHVCVASAALAPVLGTALQHH